jgi:hypothetical protein
MYTNSHNTRFMKVFLTTSPANFAQSIPQTVDVSSALRSPCHGFHSPSRHSIEVFTDSATNPDFADQAALRICSDPDGQAIHIQQSLMHTHPLLSAHHNHPILHPMTVTVSLNFPRRSGNS